MKPTFKGSLFHHCFVLGEISEKQNLMFFVKLKLCVSQE